MARNLISIAVIVCVLGGLFFLLRPDTVYLAHRISLRLLRDPRRALWSQIPMLVLMVLYTVSSLWILAQPIVE
ncbi:MAG: hypothetical protein M3Q49_09900 [Actinomycetota bacterium]|nr:hypothetical protein [Actinomycetota bacterium]MDP9486078.1 hypothetical protein [Actinomycetota bacterium]